MVGPGNAFEEFTITSVRNREVYMWGFSGAAVHIHGGPGVRILTLLQTHLASAWTWRTLTSLQRVLMP